MDTLLLHNLDTIEKLAQAIQLSSRVQKLNREYPNPEDKPEAFAIAHGLSDIEESMQRIYGDLIPKILSCTSHRKHKVTEELDMISGWLVEIREEFRHIFYHIYDSKLYHSIISTKKMKRQKIDINSNQATIKARILQSPDKIRQLTQMLQKSNLVQKLNQKYPNTEDKPEAFTIAQALSDIEMCQYQIYILLLPEMMRDVQDEQAVDTTLLRIGENLKQVVVSMGSCKMFQDLISPDYILDTPKGKESEA